MLANQSISALVDNSLPEDKLTYEIKLNENLKAPIEQNDILGTVSYTIDGISYETNLVASHYVEESKFLLYIFEFGIVFLILIFLYKLLFAKKKKKF